MFVRVCDNNNPNIPVVGPIPVHEVIELAAREDVNGVDYIVAHIVDGALDEQFIHVEPGQTIEFYH